MKSEILENMENFGEQDLLFDEALKAFEATAEFSIAELQRKYRIGYGRSVALYKALVNAQPCAPRDAPQAARP